MAASLSVGPSVRCLRLVLRAARNNKNINVVAVNDPFVPTDYMNYSECSGCLVSAHNRPVTPSMLFFAWYATYLTLNTSKLVRDQAQQHRSLRLTLTVLVHDRYLVHSNTAIERSVPTSFQTESISSYRTCRFRRRQTNTNPGVLCTTYVPVVRTA